MATTNDVTGDAIQSRAASEAYANNYDAIFKKNTLPEGCVAVKDLKSRQLVYDLDVDDSYRVYGAPRIVKGQWEVETTSSGDYVVVFGEGSMLWTSAAARDEYLKTK